MHFTKKWEFIMAKDQSYEKQFVDLPENTDKKDLEIV